MIAQLSLALLVLPGTDECNGLRCSVAAVGDLDGDGAADFALARRSAGPAGFGVADPDPGPGPGVVWLVSGKDGRLLRTLEPPRGDNTFGRALADLGDLNGDGQRELAVAGTRTWVFSGADGAVLHDRLPRGVPAGGGDFDGDGVPDYLIGANEDGMDCDPGFALVLSGADGKRIHGLEFGYDAGGQCGPGVDVCSLGDVDGDGLPEVVVHIPRLREARILSGADFSAHATVDLRAAPFAGR